MQKSNTKLSAIIAWCFYDWANSAFPTIVTTFIFAAYFTESIAKNKIVGTAQWGDAIAIAGISIAILSPIVGAIADYEGRRKPWLAFFSLLCIVASFMLWFAKPSTDYIYWTLIWLIIGTIGLEVSMVFYNSMMHDLAPKGYLGRISGWSWGFGYFGGLICLIIALIFFVQGDVRLFNLNTKMAEQIRITAPLAALWYLIFAWPLFVFTPDQASKRIGYKKAIHLGVYSLWQTITSLNQYKEVFKFLLARLFYIDGLNTIFVFGGIYAAGTFYMSFSEIILFGITMNIAAGIGAISFAWLDDLVGAKQTIMFALIIMILSGSGTLIVTSKLWFWVLGMGVSLCVGPVQAASRSLMTTLSPPELLTEMFGLYALSGKFTAFLGPWILGMITLTFNSQRIGMGTVFIFLLIGLILLSTVKVKKLY